MVKWLPLLILSCVRVASPRAERDLTVGHGAEVDVENGYAAIRSITPGAIHLRANAPTLSITTRVAASLRIDNVFSDVEVVDDAGTRLNVQHTRPTSITVSVPVGHVTVRAPITPDGPYRFAMYADVQDAIDTVQDIYTRMNADSSIRFALLAGDLTQQGTREELERFEREMETLTFPVFATLGNHELGQGNTTYHDYFGRGSSSFVFRGVRFTLLDSASATIDPEVYDWLDEWLALGRNQLHVVSMHIAPIDPVGARSGCFASRNEANKLLAKLAAGRVDLTLYGHVHSYYAFENAGIPAHIAGGGGAIPERMDGIGRHYLVVDVDPTTQTQVTGLVRVD
jgi:3',5'-cyclic-AMP phosphodiesterase